MYQPKKERYNDLTSLVKEMTDAGEKMVIFDGHKVTTNDAKYTLYDGKVTVISLGQCKVLRK